MAYDHSKQAERGSVGVKRDDVANLEATLGLCIRVAKAKLAACAVLTANAKAAFDAAEEDLAIDAIFDVEPVLHEAQTNRTVAISLRRIVREAQTTTR